MTDDLGDRPGALVTDGGLRVRTVEETTISDYVAPIELDEILDALDAGILLVDDTNRIVSVNEAVVADVGTGRRQLVGQHIENVVTVSMDGSWAGSAQMGLDHSEPTVMEGSVHVPGDEPVPAEVTVMPRRHVGGPAGVLVVYHRLETDTGVSTEGQLDRLGLINQFNATLRRVTRSILNPSCRRELDEVVCTELASGTPYEFALVLGTADTSDRRITPRAWAGVEDSFVDDLLSVVDRQNDTECPVTQALETGSIQVAHRIDADLDAIACGETLPKDVSSVAVVPIAHSETDYGVLAVYSARESPFDDFEVRMLQELGDIVGLAYNMVAKDELLTTDTVLELEFLLSDGGSYLATASTAESCRITLESVVPRNDTERLYYFRVVGGSGEGLIEYAMEHPEVEGGAVLSEQGEECRIVLKREEWSILEHLGANNVNVRALEAEGGILRLRLEASPTIDIDVIESLLERTYAEVELTAKRQGRAASVTEREFRHEVFHTLTDKQRQTLEAAFQGGYFSRPRDSTAEEIAGHLGISSSTFHQHLRAAMSKLMTVLLDPSVDQAR